jgi:hypothetical protein
MPKLLKNSLGEYNKSCSAPHQESSKIAFAIFWIFYNFLEILQVSANVLYYWGYPFAQGPLELLKSSHIYPSLALRPLGKSQSSHPYPLAAGRPWPTSGAGPPRGSPRVDWRGWTARAQLQRGRSATTGRGGSGDGEGRRSAGKRVNAWVLARPKEGGNVVGRLGELVEDRARHEDDNGGRRLGARPRGGTGAFYRPRDRPAVTVGWRGPRCRRATALLGRRAYGLLTVYFGAPSMFITLWFGFDYGTNPPLGTLII